MKNMKLSRSIVGFLAVILSALPVLSQAPASPAGGSAGKSDPAANLNLLQKSSSANIRSYVNDPVPKLLEAVGKLHGLRPESSQDQLPSLLERTGGVLEELLRDVPDLISHEDVFLIKQEPTLIATEGNVLRRREFNYLILSHPTGKGRRLEEYRTDPENTLRPLGEQDSNAPQNQGFAYMWLLFLPSNQPETAFRYLGQQEMDKHETFVLAFAQHPGLVKDPAQVVAAGRSFPIFYQGIAWIDRSTFHIIRLRKDLLAPLSSIQLQRQTADLRFDDVRIAQVRSSYWLPREIEITMEFENHISREVHRYSNYHLYTAKARIVSGPQ
jgi:hypothetical protein